MKGRAKHGSACKIACHPEFISGPHRLTHPAYETLNRVQGDVFFLCLKPQDDSKNQLPPKANRRKGLTLAEVLMILMIIGMIAAMVIPNLRNNVNEQVTVTKVKKVYSSLQNAYKLSVANGDPPAGWTTSGRATAQGARDIIDHLGLYIKYDKNNGTTAGLLNPATTKLLDDTPWYPMDSWGNFAKARLADGTVVVAWNHGSGCSIRLGEGEALGHICANIYVDIDGKNGPNVMGKDFFGFFLTSEGFLPAGTTKDTFHTIYNSCRMKTKGTDANINGFGCTAWVLYKGNMDYLKREISWSE